MTEKAKVQIQRNMIYIADYEVDVLPGGEFDLAPLGDVLRHLDEHPNEPPLVWSYRGMVHFEAVGDEEHP